MVTEEMKSMDTGLPLDYMVLCGSIVNHIELGFSYKEAESAEIAKRIYVPTLVINSEIDKTTPYFMGKDIYDSLASAKKELWTVTDSEHIGMWRDYNEKYCSKVLDLIK